MHALLAFQTSRALVFVCLHSCVHSCIHEAKLMHACTARSTDTHVRRPPIRRPAYIPKRMHAYISCVCSCTHPPKRMHAYIMNHIVCEHWCTHACMQLAGSIPTHRPVFLHAHRSHFAVRASQGTCMYACMHTDLIPACVRFKTHA